MPAGASTAAVDTDPGGPRPPDALRPTRTASVVSASVGVRTAADDPSAATRPARALPAENGGDGLPPAVIAGWTAEPPTAPARGPAGSTATSGSTAGSDSTATPGPTAGLGSTSGSTGSVDRPAGSPPLAASQRTRRTTASGRSDDEEIAAAPGIGSVPLADIGPGPRTLPAARTGSVAQAQDATRARETSAAGIPASDPNAPIDFNRPTAPRPGAASAGGAGSRGGQEATDRALLPAGDGSLAVAINAATVSNGWTDAAGRLAAIDAPGLCTSGTACQPGTVGGTSGGGTSGGSTSGGSTSGGSTSGGSTSGGSTSGGSTSGGSTSGGSTSGGGTSGGGTSGGGTSGGGTILTAGLNEADRVSVRTLQSPWVDLNLTASNAAVRLDEAYRLESIGLCPSLLCVARGTAQVVEAGHNNDLAWGRWVNGTARVTVLFLQSERPIGSNSGVHYLVGVPTVTMPTSGTAYYAFGGATSPTFASGAVAPGSFTGQGLVQFASGDATRVAFKGDMVFGSGERYHLFSQGARQDSGGRLVEIGDTQVRMTGRTTFSGSIGVVSQGSADRAGCGTANCQAQVNGGFFGADAARMGVTYSVGRTQGGGDTINGVAVLNRQ